MKLRESLILFVLALLVFGCGKVTVVGNGPGDDAAGDTPVADTPTPDTPVADTPSPDTPVTDTVSTPDAAPPEDTNNSPVNQELCADYCDFATETCLGAGAEVGVDPQLMGFATKLDCQNKCGHWAGLPAGSSGDTAKNTVQCRIYHTSAALEDPETHCSHASLSGGNKCGTWCEVYCHLALLNCTGSTAFFQDIPSCLAVCSSFKDDGLIGAQTGDSVQCRLEMALRAGSEPPQTQVEFCPHASPGSTKCDKDEDPFPTE
jgi:hypothetical protein